MHPSIPQWIHQALGTNDVTIKNGHCAADFRRYWRLQHPGGCCIWMQITQPGAIKSQQFRRVNQLLDQHDIRVPKIIHCCNISGEMLMEDLGNATLLKYTQANPSQTTKRYLQAIDIIHQLWNIPAPHGAEQRYALRQKIETQFDNTLRWFLHAWCGQQTNAQQTLRWQHDTERLIQSWQAQPLSWCHQDYHGDNLMLTPSSLAVIDHQDLSIGPMAYDVASLIFEHYAQHSPEQQQLWLQRSHQLIQQHSNLSAHTWEQHVHACAMVRYIKNLGVFARLCLRDQKWNYQPYIQQCGRFIIKQHQSYPEWTWIGQLAVQHTSPYALQETTA